MIKDFITKEQIKDVVESSNVVDTNDPAQFYDLNVLQKTVQDNYNELKSEVGIYALRNKTTGIAKDSTDANIFDVDVKAICSQVNYGIINGGWYGNGGAYDQDTARYSVKTTNAFNCAAGDTVAIKFSKTVSGDNGVYVDFFNGATFISRVQGATTSVSVVAPSGANKFYFHKTNEYVINASDYNEKDFIVTVNGKTAQSLPTLNYPVPIKHIYAGEGANLFGRPTSYIDYGHWYMSTTGELQNSDVRGVFTIQYLKAGTYTVSVNKANKIMSYIIGARSRVNYEANLNYLGRVTLSEEKELNGRYYKTGVITEDGYYTVAVDSISSFSDMENLQFMIEAGTVPTMYEEYHGASEVKATGKNLFNWKTVFDDFFRYSNSNILRRVYKLKPNSPYTISQGTNYNNLAWIYAVTGYNVGFSAGSNVNGCTVGNPRTVYTDDNGYLTVGVNRNINGANGIQLEYGTVATEYNEYKESVAKLLVNMYGIGDVRDELDLEAGTITRRCGVADLGTLTYDYDSQNTRFGSESLKQLCQKNPNRRTAGYSTIYRILSNGEAYDASWDGVIYFDNASLNIHNKAYSDVNTFKSAMSGVLLIYPLETPVVEQLTAAQVAQLRNLRSYYPETVYTVDNGDLEVTYAGDAKNYIDNRFTYSSEPVVVGKWVDGRDIIKQYFTVSPMSLPQSAWTVILNLPVGTMETLVSVTAYNYTGGSHPQHCCIPCVGLVETYDTDKISVFNERSTGPYNNIIGFMLEYTTYTDGAVPAVVSEEV